MPCLGLVNHFPFTKPSWEPLAQEQPPQPQAGLGAPHPTLRLSPHEATHPPPPCSCDM